MGWNKFYEPHHFMERVIFHKNVQFNGDIGIRSLSSALMTTGLLTGRAIAQEGSALAHADKNNPDHANAVIGILAGPQAVITAGEVAFTGWAFTAGLPVFLSFDGTLTHTPPTTGFQQRIGVATASGSMIIALGDAIVLA